MNISYGLVDPADIFLSEWNGGILGPHGVSYQSVSEEVKCGTCGTRMPHQNPSAPLVP